MKNRTIVNTSIFVTCITILAILPGWFSFLLFKTSLNSPIYYGIVIVLTVASIVFGILQWTAAYDKKRTRTTKDYEEPHTHL